MEYEIKISKINLKNKMFEIFRIMSLEAKFNIITLIFFFLVNNFQIGFFISNIIFKNFNTNFTFKIEQFTTINTIINSSDLLIIVKIILTYAYIKSFIIIIILIKLFYQAYRGVLKSGTISTIFFKYLIWHTWV